MIWEKSETMAVWSLSYDQESQQCHYLILVHNRQVEQLEHKDDLLTFNWVSKLTGKQIVDFQR